MDEHCRDAFVLGLLGLKGCLCCKVCAEPSVPTKGMQKNLSSSVLPFQNAPRLEFQGPEPYYSPTLQPQPG